jgi:hypothetical protein
MEPAFSVTPAAPAASRKFPPAKAFIHAHPQTNIRVAQKTPDSL